jgi:riboflavin biosynthesis pyrimidine reductase
MGTNTYRLMSGFAAGPPRGDRRVSHRREEHLWRTHRSVENGVLLYPRGTALLGEHDPRAGDAVKAVRAMKAGVARLLSTMGSISLCRSLLRAGIVDRFRVVMFPVITDATGSERIYDGYPDVVPDMIASATFDERIQLVEYRPRVLEHPPLKATA